MARQQSWWGKATINGQKYEMAAPCIPQVLPDVVPAFRTGPTALEHRVGGRWWEARDFSLGVGGEDIDIYQPKHHIAWGENVDVSFGGAIMPGYRNEDDSSAVDSYLTPPEMATPAAFSSIDGVSKKLYAVFGNTVYKRTSGGAWSSIGTMTGTTSGRSVVEPRSAAGTDILVFVGWADGSDPDLYRTADGNNISVLKRDLNNPISGVAATVLPVYSAVAPYDRLYVSSQDGIIRSYYNTGGLTWPPSSKLPAIKLPGPMLFLAPRFDHYLTSGIWGLINGVLWNLFLPQGDDTAYTVRVRWGRNLAGGCMHGRYACVFSGLRIWLISESGESEDISPIVEELVGFASGTALSFTSATSDGEHIYATVCYLNQEWVWMFDGTGWSPISEPTLGSPTAVASISLLVDGYSPSDRSLWWFYTYDAGTDAVRCRQLTLPQGLRQSGRDKTGDSAVGRILLPWFTGGSPEPGTLYKHWLEHTVPTGAQIVVTKRTNYGAYDNDDLSPNTISGQVTAERKATFIVCGGDDGLPFSSAQFQYTLQANSSGVMPRIHAIGFEWYKATKVKLYPVYLAFREATKDMSRKLVQMLLTLELDRLYTLTVPYVCTDEVVRFIGSQPTNDATVIRFDFQTV